MTAHDSILDKKKSPLTQRVNARARQKREGVGERGEGRKFAKEKSETAKEARAVQLSSMEVNGAIIRADEGGCFVRPTSPPHPTLPRWAPQIDRNAGPRYNESGRLL